MERAIRILNATDWKSFYYVTMGALIGSSFNLHTVASVGIGAAGGFLLLNAVTRWNN